MPTGGTIPKLTTVAERTATLAMKPCIPAVTATEPTEMLLQMAKVALIECPANFDRAIAKLLEAARTDARLLWELLTPYGARAARSWLARANDELRQRQAADAGAGRNEREALGQNSREDRQQRAPRPACSADLVAVSNVAWLSVLDTFLVDGRPIGQVTAADAMQWAGKRERDVRFVRMLTADLPPDEPIGKHRSNEQAAAFFARAGEPQS